MTKEYYYSILLLQQKTIAEIGGFFMQKFHLKEVARPVVENEDGNEEAECIFKGQER